MIKTKSLGQFDLSFEKGINPIKSNEGDSILIPSGSIYANGVNFSKTHKVIVNRNDIVKILKKGDILFNTGGEGTIGRSTYFNYEIENCFSDGFVLCIRNNDKFTDPKFIFYCLNTFEAQNQIYRLKDGTTGITSIKTSNIKKLNVPVFEFTEQTQIATILSKVDEAIAQTEQLIAKYTRIKTGLMQDLLTKGIDEHGNIRSEATHEFKDSPLGRIPKEWECVLFDEIISNFDSGWSPNCEARQATIGEWGSLKTTAITWGGYDSNENKKLPDNLIPRKRLEVAFDDILITRVGPRERVGVLVHVDDDRSKLMLSDNMLRIKLNKSKELFYPFIPLMVSSDKIQREFKNKIAGLAEAQVVINQQSIKSTYILIPSKEEQTTIFNKSQVIKKAVNVEQIKLSKLQSLKTGLMQDLLSGKVRVNHLIKETASV